MVTPVVPSRLFPGGGSGKPPTANPTAGLDPNQQGAYAIIQQTLQLWGLDSLYNDALGLVKQGLNGDAITLQLEQTDAFKQRFAGNLARQKAGLPVLSPAEYISTEEAYRQVFRTYGLPSGFYDQSSDLANFIGKDISPQELDTRAQEAKNFINTADPTVKDVWQRYYGLSDGDAIATILNPDKALPLVQKKAQAAVIGAAGSRAGVSVDQSRAEQLAGLGVSQDQASQGFGQVAQIAQPTADIARRFGLDYSQTDAENEVFLNSADAQRKRQQVDQYEQAQFGGGAGASQNAFGRGSGSF